MTHVRKISAILLAAVSQFAIHAASAAESGDAVIKWNANAGMAAMKACMNATENNDPFHESRMYAMMHIAIHDALNAIDRKYQPYAYDQKAPPGASLDAAVAAASYNVVQKLIDQLPAELGFTNKCTGAGTSSIQASYKAALDVIPDSDGKKQGIALGQAAAAAILAKRADDHGATGPFLNMTCPAQVQPGQYQCTPGYPFVGFEMWEKVTPFVLQDNAQFRPGPPPALTDEKFVGDLNEVKSMGGDGKTTPSARTDDQTQIALFWLENSPLKWSRIARTVSVDKGQTPWENARLFAILNMGLADGYIAMAASKNQYGFWRPITAIQHAGDMSWTPLAQTPPDQDYPSVHSIESGVGAGVLRHLLGSDEITFKDCGTTLPVGSRCDDPTPAMRTFTRFTQAADENLYSRVLIGFHFRNSAREGTDYGYKIAERAVTLLPPVSVKTVRD